MLSGQLAINRGAEPSGPLIAPGKKAVAEVERPSEQEEVQGASYASLRGFIRLARHLLEIRRGGSSPIGGPNRSPNSRRDREIPTTTIPRLVSPRRDPESPNP